MRGNDKENQGNNSQVFGMLFLITQIGFTMLVTIFLCVGLGYAVDRFFHTRLMALFIVLGVVAGFRSVYILIRRYINQPRS